MTACRTVFHSGKAAVCRTVSQKGRTGLLYRESESWQRGKHNPAVKKRESRLLPASPAILKLKIRLFHISAEESRPAICRCAAPYAPICPHRAGRGVLLFAPWKRHKNIPPVGPVKALQAGLFAPYSVYRRAREKAGALAQAFSFSIRRASADSRGS